MSHYDPDELHLTKQEIIQVLEVLVKRWQKNPNANWLFIKKLKLEIAFLKSRFVKESDLNYYWSEMFRLLDAIRTANALKADQFAKALSDNANRHMQEDIDYVPPPISPQVAEQQGNTNNNGNGRAALKVDFRNSLKFGAMKERND